MQRDIVPIKKKKKKKKKLHSPSMQEGNTQERMHRFAYSWTEP